jgi:glucosamine kinase
VIGAAIALDAGQTGIRVLLSNGFEREFPGILTHEALIPQLADIVAAVVKEAGVRLDSVSAGVSGLRADDDPAELLELCRRFGAKSAHLAHDSVTSYLGALGYERGAVVAAGTGVVTLGVGRTDVARVDGWGNIMGDAGSGYWIGRAGLDAVMRAHDGRGESTALTAIVAAEFADLEQAYVELQTDSGRVRRIAAYSRSVAELADSDHVCAAICAEAARELVLSASTALRSVGEAQAPIVCAIGGVFRGTAVRTAFDNGMRDLWPEVDLRAPIGSGLDGAALLPLLAHDSALRPHVSVARLS